MFRKISIVIGLFTLLASVSGLAEFVVPPLTGPVVDQVGILSKDSRRSIEQQLLQLRKEKGAQVQVFVVESLHDETIEEVAIKTFDQWKLGQGQVDNGILFVIAPNERKLRIEVGRGFEGVLPDVVARRIISDGVVPYFRKKQFEAGVQVGVNQIISVVKEEPIGAPVKSQEESARGMEFWIVILFIVISILFNRFGGGGGFRRGRSYSSGWGGGGFGGSGGWSGGGSSWGGGGGGSSGGGSSDSW